MTDQSFPTKKQIKKSYLHKNSISTGNLFFDRILGGFSLGTTVLFIQDSFSKLNHTFFRYFLAEGMVKNNKTIFLHNNDIKASTIVEQIPYKSTQIESLLNAKKISDLKNDEMKIAWRYENIKYSNIIEDIAKSADYVFDLSRGIQEEYRKYLNIINLDKRFEKCNLNSEEEHKTKHTSEIEDFDRIIKTIISTAQDHLHLMEQQNPENDNLDQDQKNEKINKEKREMDKEKFAEMCKLRYLVTELKFPFSMSKGDFTKFKSRLQALKNIARSLNGVILISVNPFEICPEGVDLLRFYCDYVFRINSFMMTNDKIEDYDGIFKLEKIPRINCLKMIMHDIESETYGLILEKRKLIIEQVDIGVEIDRNTKVKEKDVQKKPEKAVDF